jgi:hypothetical protein
MGAGAREHDCGEREEGARAGRGSGDEPMDASHIRLVLGRRSGPRTARRGLSRADSPKGGTKRS